LSTLDEIIHRLLQRLRQFDQATAGKVPRWDAGQLLGDVLFVHVHYRECQFPVAEADAPAALERFRGDAVAVIKFFVDADALSDCHGIALNLHMSPPGTASLRPYNVDVELRRLSPAIGALTSKSLAPIAFSEWSGIDEIQQLIESDRAE
jgi:hypothetical protein